MVPNGRRALSSLTACPDLYGLPRQADWIFLTPYPGLYNVYPVLSGRLGSQFFLTLAEQLEYLDGEHCVFGQVVEGQDVLVKLNAAICDDKHQPYQDIR